MLILNNLERIKLQFFFALAKKIKSRTGNNTRFVNVATKSVTEVSQPNAMVPPKLLTQKIINPAINTSEVYTILRPVFFMVRLLFRNILLLINGQFLFIVYQETNGNINCNSQCHAKNQYGRWF